MSTTSFHTASSSSAPYASGSVSGAAAALDPFSVAVDLFVPDHLGTNLRKSSAHKKRSESKLGGFLGPLAGSSQDGQRKLKEQHSSLNIPKATSTGGQWRPATCTTADYADGCLLNIYVDETTLFRTIPLHLLNHTDIRAADRSLFFRKFCLGIHSSSGQTIGNTHTSDTVYIDFPSAEALGVWTALLRSFATPEVYGRHISAVALSARSGRSGASEGGLYRMWRQVQLSVLEGRAIGTAVPAPGELPPASPPPGGAGAGTDEHGAFCEVSLDAELAARTTVRTGRGGAHEWQAAFVLADLPPIQTLAIAVCRERRSGKPGKTVVGRVIVNMGNVRRGEEVEGWWPVLSGGDADAGGFGPVMQVGEVKLKLRVDEEIILPMSAYSGLLEALVSRNFLEWLQDFDTKLKLKTVPLRLQLASIALSRNVLVDSVIDEATRELNCLPSTSNPNTLFRGNSSFTKTMELVMTKLGTSFLEASVGPVVRRLCAEGIAIEVDPLRNDRHMDVRDIERNVTALATWCNEFWKAIWATRGDCPQELRRIFQHIRQLVEQRRPPPDVDGDMHRDSAWQSVSAFLFLRYFVPAILRPHLFGLVPGLPKPSVCRTLTLVGKHIQTLANISTHVERAEFMRPVKNFLTDNLPAMIDYLLEVSTPSPTAPTTSILDRSDAAMMAAVRQRAASLPLLHREAIPSAPLLLDVPKHLAILTSTVIQHSRGVDERAPQGSTYASTYASTRGSTRGPPSITAPQLDALVARCFEVEARALRRVSRLVAQPHSIRTRASVRPSTPGTGSDPGASSYGGASDGGSLASPHALQPASPFAPSFPSSAATSAGDSPSRMRKLSSPSARSGRWRKLSRSATVLSLDSQESLPHATRPLPPLSLSAPPVPTPRGAWSRSSAPDIWMPSGTPTEDILHPPNAPYASTGALSRIASAESMPSLRQTESSGTSLAAGPCATGSTKKKRGFLRYFSKGNV